MLAILMVTILAITTAVISLEIVYDTIHLMAGESS
jgi:hypothetical protein